MNSKHTPGPWKMIIHRAVDGGDYIQILAGSWDIAHNRYSTRDWEEEKANAKLIADAPTIAEKIKEMAIEIAEGYPDIENVDCWEQLCAIRSSYQGTKAACGDLHKLIDLLRELLDWTKLEMVEFWENNKK